MTTREADIERGRQRNTLTPEQVRYDLKRKRTSSTSSAGLPKWRAV